jgi:L-iditol 2-dehydrogenase
VQELTSGRGADITIEATGNPAAVREGMQMTRDNGRFVVVGQYTDAGTVEINPHWDINRKHLEIRGCWGTDFSHVYRGVKVVAKHGERFGYERFISRKYSLEEANQALADVEELKVVKAVIEP